MTESEPRYAAFISYASEDREAAFEVADRLEEAGHVCWIAPRDVRAGQDYGAEIIRGIERSNAIVLVLSQHSNNSKFVKAEVERAYSKDKTVFPVRVEDVMPAPHLELFVSSSHWVDAFQGDLDKHFAILTSEVANAGQGQPEVTAVKPDGNVKRSKLGKSRSPVPMIATAVVAAAAIGLWLWQTGKTPATQEPGTEDVPENSVAVLPFVNMSSDPEQEYFSDGIAEELLNILSQIEKLKVAARTSSFQFKGENLDIGNVGVQLNVAHVLEGAVRKAGNRVRITAQLIDADTGYHLWSETFDRELDDIFAIQDEISQAIVTALKDVLNLTDDAQLPLANTSSSTEAYDQYLLGQHFLRTRQQASITKAIEHFAAAIVADRKYAPAYAAQSLAWGLLTAGYGSYGHLSLDEMAAKAMPLAEKALELDPQLAEAYAARGLIFFRQQKLSLAMQDFDMAVQLNPNYAYAHSTRAWVARELGNYQEEFESARAAAELDPLSLVAQGNYVFALFLRQRFDEMGPHLQRVKVHGEHYLSYQIYWYQWHRGEYAAAISTILDGRDSDPNYRALQMGQVYMFGLIGLYEESVQDLALADRLVPLQWQGDWGKVIDLAQDDYAADPNDLRNATNLGHALLASGDVDAAAPYLERYTDSFGDGVGPSAITAGYVALIRQARGEGDAVRTMLDTLKTRQARAIAGEMVNSDLDYLTAMIALIEGNEEEALDALRLVSQGPGIEPQIAASLRILTPLGDNLELDNILNAQATHIEKQQEELLRLICNGSKWKNWQPLTETCGD